MLVIACTALLKMGAAQKAAALKNELVEKKIVPVLPAPRLKN